MLEDEDWLSSFITTSRQRLAERNLLVRKFLQEKNIEFFNGANAGFFIWVDLRPFLPNTDANGRKITDEWDREAELVRRMKERKVYLTDGRCLSAEEAGWFRVIFSQEDDVIKKGFKRVFEIIGVVLGWYGYAWVVGRVALDIELGY
ncbi:hypothetical protein BDV97DRAFT_350371 [Delphinella strobiligena]|nr:hypothetical protein BDV97DRAFT_350371 [Delphinella strobiligena]